MKATDLDPETAGHFKTLEGRIREGDGQGIEARWAFGRAVLDERVGGQLPKGRLNLIGKAAGVGRAEIVARAALATRYPTKGKLADAVRKFPTWREMTHKGLIVKPRAKRDPAAVKLSKERRNAREFIETIEQAMFALWHVNSLAQFGIDLDSYERTGTFKRTMGLVLTEDERAVATRWLKVAQESATSILDFMIGSDPDEAKARKLDDWIRRAKVRGATDGEIANATAIAEQLRARPSTTSTGVQA